MRRRPDRRAPARRGPCFLRNSSSSRSNRSSSRAGSTAVSSWTSVHLVSFDRSGYADADASDCGGFRPRRPTGSLVAVQACGVCRTDLQSRTDFRLPEARSSHIGAKVSRRRARTRTRLVPATPLRARRGSNSCSCASLFAHLHWSIDPPGRFWSSRSRTAARCWRSARATS